MINVTAFYPSKEGGKFDMRYYCDSHMPMVRQKLGAACKSAGVEEGISGVTRGSPPAFIAMGHLYFDSFEAFQTAFAPHAEAIMADIHNYTDIEPVIQISEVKM
jgi:uncharacterized protein (TIGR02118 family)